MQKYNKDDEKAIDEFLKQYGSYVAPGQMQAFRLFSLNTRAANRVANESKNDSQSKVEKECGNNNEFKTQASNRK